jgi:geranylgeranyl diphosphate synthase type II
MDLENYLAEKRAFVDQALDAVIPPESAYPSSIHKAMRYCLFAGGKRLRPVLAIAAADAVGENGDSIAREACSLELIHTYSLIHDDLPSMDNDDFRRGRSTTHKVFGEALAILAGDALLTEAFALLSGSMLRNARPAQVTLEAVQLLAEAAGSRGLIAGQVVDLESEGRVIDETLLDYMHTHKTGSLITASVMLGATLAGATLQQLDCLRAYGEAIGLAFQITDDILDVTGTTSDLGKTAGSDAKKNKATYPALHGMKNAQDRLHALYETAIHALQSFDEKADPLRGIARYIIERTS